MICRMVLSLFTLMVMVAQAQAQEIATCRAPAGWVYYHFDGLVDKARSGWSEDKISKGVYALTKTGEDSFDILYVDANNKPISSTQDGGIVRLLRSGSNILTLLVFYQVGTTEIYSFFKEKDGRFRFSLMQNRTGEAMPISKSSVMVGDCDLIRFDRR